MTARAQSAATRHQAASRARFVADAPGGRSCGLSGGGGARGQGGASPPAGRLPRRGVDSWPTCASRHGPLGGAAARSAMDYPPVAGFV